LRGDFHADRKAGVVFAALQQHGNENNSQSHQYSGADKTLF
jgi:hypothetical protein